MSPSPECLHCFRFGFSFWEFVFLFKLRGTKRPVDRHHTVLIGYWRGLGSACFNSKRAQAEKPVLCTEPGWPENTFHTINDL